MAERRMFAKTIVLSDEFLDMPLSARCLYFTLGMLADDEGFVNNPKGIMRQCGASQDDMNILLSKNFVLLFESGVIVIKHWKINNYLRSDRFQNTKYIDERDKLVVKENGAYSFGIPNSGIPSIDKDSIDKDSIDKDSIDILEGLNDGEQTVHRPSSDGRGTSVTVTDKYKEKIEEIVDYLNQVLGTHYQPTTKATVRVIKARLEEGFTVDDFKTVISRMDKQWQNTQMAQYLRPETLFGNKFEGYLNRIESRVVPDNKRNILSELDKVVI